MVNINFHQENQQNKSASKKNKMLNGSFFISILILVVSFSIFFGIKVFHSQVKNETILVKGQIEEELRSLGRDKINQVADFQKRMDKIETSLSSNKNPKDIMSKVESLMVPGVVLTAYKYDSSKKSLDLEAVSDSFKKIADQILSLKNSNYFQDVRVSKTSRGEGGEINFSLESKLVFENN